MQASYSGLLEQKHLCSAAETLRNRTREIINHRYFVPACLTAGVLLRILWIALVNAPQVSDYRWYYQRAIDIANGRGYSVDGVPTAYWPVGYPGFLGGVFSVFGQSAFVGELFNVFLYLGTVFLTYMFSREVFHSEIAARVTLLILSFYPNQIAYTALLSSEILFVFLLMLGAVLFISAKGRIGLLLLSGLSWGLATLTKPQAIFIPLIFLGVFFTTTRTFVKSAAAVFLTLLLVIVPWMSRNYLVMGTPSLCTDGGIDLLDGNNPFANGRHNWDDRVASMLGDLATDRDNMFDGKEVAREARARELAINYIRHHLWRTVSLWPKKLWVLYFSDVDGFFYSLGMVETHGQKFRTAYVGLRAVAEIYYLLIGVLCLASLPTLLSAHAKSCWIGIAVAIYFTAIYMVFFANARYHFPIMPWLTLYSGIGAGLLLKSNEKLAVSPGSGREADDSSDAVG